MEFYSSINTVPKLDSSVLTLGSFDGVHYGHKQLLTKLQNRAKSLQVPSVLITFHPHPKEVLLRNKEIPVELLTTIAEKKEIIEKEFEIDHFVIIPFTQKLSQVTALDFLKTYIMESFSPAEIIIGYDHNFGKGREGDQEFLQNHEEQFHYKTVPVEAVKLPGSGKIVSSSGIRDLLSDGNTLDAIEYLTRPYGVTGIVREGAKRGRVLNYPTANISLPNDYKLLPKDGIYLVYVTGEDVDCYGACSIGYRPTFDDGIHTIEVFLLEDPPHSLYSHKLTVHFFHRLRDEEKFDRVEDLVNQMQKDVYQCEEIIQTQNPWRQYQEELVI